MQTRGIGALVVCALFAGCTGRVGQGTAALSSRKPGVSANVFSNYESAHVHPLDVTPDGKRLLAVNTANGTLEIFDLSAQAVSLTTVVKVGVDPVTVRAASNTEAWVVNVLSDSVSVVDLAAATVKTTLATDDEPADVVFAGSPRRAYVSCAQARTLLVIDPAQPTQVLARIPILGQQPRALATSPDGSKVYLAIFESGNGTTVLSGKDNPVEPNIVRDPTGPYGGVNPPPNANNATTFNPPMNPANPPPPSGVSVIVRRTASGDWLDDNGRSWKRFVTEGNPAWGARARTAGWDLVDRDVAIIDTATSVVSYQGGMMNIVMAIAVNPASGRVTVVGTDATNEVRFEPILNGRFLRVLSGGFLQGQASATCDLNSHLTYATPSVPVSERNKSIGDPRAITWNAAGTRAYVSGMGSNNLVVFDASCQRAGLAPTIDVGQGPTGVVLQEARRRAFVLNRFDATISVVNLDSETVTDTVPLSYDPTPQVVRDGRPMLYDTHRNSGLGHVACASCHVDGKTDRLAWDRGNPAGEMVTVTDASGKTVQHHPMKGPFLTQSLEDTMQSYLLHWRGDMVDLGHFSGAFQSLLGRDQAATPSEIAALRAFLQTVRLPPNPYRNLDNSFPTTVVVPGARDTPSRVGDAVLGAAEFERSCRGCHLGQTGRGKVLKNTEDFAGGNYLLPPRWQNFYRRTGLWFGDATGSTSGFGFQPDGTFDSTHNQTRSDNLMAFMFAFNGSFPYTPAGLDEHTVAVDSHAAVGKQAMISSAGVADAQLERLVDLANTQAIGLVASGCMAGERRGYVYRGAGVFQSDRDGETATLTSLRSAASANGAITFTAVRAGTEGRIGIDEDLDSVLDGTSSRTCTSTGTPNLLVNGSFEDNTAQAGEAAQVPSLAGWQGSSGLIEVWRNLGGFAGADGSSWVELDVGWSWDRLSQTVATTPGEWLVLGFAYSARPGVSPQSNRFDVIWNGTVIDTLSPDGSGLRAPVWKVQTYTVQATGNDTVTFAESGDNDGYGALLDAVSLVRGASPPIPPANLLVNGSFEANDVGAGGWAQVTSLAGWQGSAGVIEVWHNLMGWAGANGGSWIELDAAWGWDRVSQAVKTTAGQGLALSFAYSARPGVSAQSNRFDVIWNGAVIDTLSPEGSGLSAPAWTTKTYSVQATGNDTVTFAESGANDGYGGLIDAVSLVRTSSPAASASKGIP